MNNERTEICNKPADLYYLERVIDHDSGTTPDHAFAQYITGANNAQALDQHPVGHPHIIIQKDKTDKTQYGCFQT